jgi:hypothetical protein
VLKYLLKYWHNQVRRIDTALPAALAKALQTTSIDLLEKSLRRRSSQAPIIRRGSVVISYDELRFCSV